jgi:UDP-3-O-[3-hydroxymyristoyl] N-acetylglucosamine deacetylase / 3-hydroxyacyl-[acyl-carrier-protein] dehydratase
MIPEFNPDKQHTLAASISASGAGLHSGVLGKLTLKPANPGFGYQFQRMDLPGKPLIKADCDLVMDTFRSTSLIYQGASVCTVEHVLAALVGMGIDNCLIQIKGPEIPIIDGSCSPFVKMIEQAGILEQHARKEWWAIDEDIVLFDGLKRVRMTAFPWPQYKISTWVDFKRSDLNIQTAELRNLADFKTEIAPCRTYCFVHDLEMLLNHNRVRGDIAHNAILIIDKPMEEKEIIRIAKKFKIKKFKIRNGGYLNNLDLRFENEIARHKLMDVIGDLALIGFPIKAQIIGKRPGHSTNVEFAKKIKQFILERKRQESIRKAI